MIAYQRCTDLAASAKLTYDNMRVYYEHFAPEWDEAKVYEQISNLENWDILNNGEVVGALRVEFDAQSCLLRDLQVRQQAQNKGLGAKAIEYADTLAEQNGATSLALRVLKISPAYRLYERVGFNTINDDQRFYYMERKVC